MSTRTTPKAATKPSTLDAAQVARLTRRSTKELQALHAKAIGRPTPSGMGRDALLRALATGAATQPKGPRGAAPATATADHAPAAQQPAEGTTTSRAGSARERDPRLPAPGSTLTKVYRGVQHEVQVLEQGFLHAGREHRSLTSVAKAITGWPSINGLLFFGLTSRAPRAAQDQPSAEAS